MGSPRFFPVFQRNPKKNAWLPRWPLLSHARSRAFGLGLRRIFLLLLGKSVKNQAKSPFFDPGRRAVICGTEDIHSCSLTGQKSVRISSHRRRNGSNDFVVTCVFGDGALQEAASLSCRAVAARDHF